MNSKADLRKLHAVGKVGTGACRNLLKKRGRGFKQNSTDGEGQIITERNSILKRKNPSNSVRISKENLINDSSIRSRNSAILSQSRRLIQSKSTLGFRGPRSLKKLKEDAATIKKSITVSDIDDSKRIIDSSPKSISKSFPKSTNVSSNDQQETAVHLIEHQNVSNFIQTPSDSTKNLLNNHSVCSEISSIYENNANLKIREFDRKSESENFMISKFPSTNDNSFSEVRSLENLNQNSKLSSQDLERLSPPKAASASSIGHALSSTVTNTTSLLDHQGVLPNITNTTSSSDQFPSTATNNNDVKLSSSMTFVDENLFSNHFESSRLLSIKSAEFENKSEIIVDEFITSSSSSTSSTTLNPPTIPVSLSPPFFGSFRPPRVSLTPPPSSVSPPASLSTSPVYITSPPISLSPPHVSFSISRVSTNPLENKTSSVSPSLNSFSSEQRTSTETRFESSDIIISSQIQEMGNISPKSSSISDIPSDSDHFPTNESPSFDFVKNVLQDEASHIPDDAIPEVSQTSTQNKSDYPSPRRLTQKILINSKIIIPNKNPTKDLIDDRKRRYETALPKIDETAMASQSESKAILGVTLPASFDETVIIPGALNIQSTSFDDVNLAKKQKITDKESSQPIKTNKNCDLSVTPMDFTDSKTASMENYTSTSLASTTRNFDKMETEPRVNLGNCSRIEISKSIESENLTDDSNINSSRTSSLSHSAVRKVPPSSSFSSLSSSSASFISSDRLMTITSSSKDNRIPIVRPDLSSLNSKLTTPSISVISSSSFADNSYLANNKVTKADSTLQLGVSTVQNLSKTGLISQFNTKSQNKNIRKRFDLKKAENHLIYMKEFREKIERRIEAENKFIDEKYYIPYFGFSFRVQNEKLQNDSENRIPEFQSADMIFRELVDYLENGKFQFIEVIDLLEDGYDIPEFIESVLRKFPKRLQKIEKAIKIGGFKLRNYGFL